MMNIFQQSTFPDQHSSPSTATSRPADDLFINQQYLQSHPIAKNASHFQQIGLNASSLILSGISESDAIGLFKHFSRLEKLTMESLTITRTDCEYFPAGLHSLKLCHCNINEIFLLSWFKILGVTLESLYLDNLRTQHSTPISVNFWSWMKNLRSLTSTGMTLGRTLMENFNSSANHCPLLETLTLNLDSHCANYATAIHPPTKSLKCLKLECRDGLSLYGSFELLEHLTIKCSEAAWDRLDIPDHLKTLEYRNLPLKIDKFLNFCNLEHVKIHCNWYHAEELRIHFKSLASIKSCRITSSPPTPGYNLSPSSLNADCLQKILSYLPLVDVMSLGVASPKLLLFINPNDLVKIDDKFLVDYPIANLPEFYLNLGLGTKQLHVDGIKEIHFIKIIAKFPNLRRLELKKMILRVPQSTAKIAKVKELSIDDCQLTMKYREALYRHLNDTLSSLHLDYKVHHLSLLHNLKELSVKEMTNSEEFEGFLKANKDLRRLSIDSYSVDLRPFVAQLNPEALKGFTLTTGTICENSSLLMPFFGRFCNLESLELNADFFITGGLPIWELSRLASLVIKINAGMADNRLNFGFLKKLTNLRRVQIEGQGTPSNDSFVVDLKNILEPLGHVSYFPTFDARLYGNVCIIIITHLFLIKPHSV